MSGLPPREESVDRFLKASEELMRLGSSFGENIDTALDSFKQRFSTILKTHFVERGVAEMLALSFSEFEKEVRTNLKGINDICTEGGQWYAFCFGTALGRTVPPPPTRSNGEEAPKARTQTAS